MAFGGGSPNALAPTDLVRLADALTLHLPLDTPVRSVEIDPRSLTRDFALVLGSIGVSHASLGVQTLPPHLQAAIGRVQPEPVIAQAAALLRANGVRSLNFDLMYGLPGQTWDDLEATLTRSVEFGADRVALFGYAHVPDLIPRQRLHAQAGVADTDLAAQVADRLAPFLSRGLATLDNGTLRIADNALAYARSIAALFDAHRLASTRTFSSAV